MRTNIDIDASLLADAMAATQLSTKKAIVEEALRLLVQRHRQIQAFENMKGLGWDGDLNAMRDNGDPASIP